MSRFSTPGLALLSALLAVPALNLSLAKAYAAQNAQAQSTRPDHGQVGGGIVKAVDLNRHTVTIQHDAVETLKWPAMVMDFPVADPSVLARLRPGDKISFLLKRERAGYVITKVTPTPKPREEE